MILEAQGMASGILPMRRRHQVLARRQTLGHNLMDRLVEWWPLHETNGLRRGVHASLHLTASGTVTALDGVGSMATAFDRGSTEHLSRTSEATLQTGDIDYTLAGWFYSTQTYGSLNWGGVIAKDALSAGTREFGFQMAGFTTPPQLFSGSFFNGSSSIGSVSATTFGALGTNTWYFFCIWHDAANNLVGCGINNVEDTAATSGPAGSGTGPLYLARGQNSNETLAGRMQRVGYWKRLLTSDEKAFLYNGGRGRDYPFI